ncbi:MAG: NAD kinase [Bacteroidetes bacterium]|nr:NAD kinase [Bacteroidota bacterium]
MKIGIYAKSVRDSKHEEGFRKLLLALESAGHEIWCTQSLVDYIHIHISSGISLHAFQYCTPQKPLIDALICVGGDGTLLDTISIVRNSQVPVLGLNTGRLGFLAGISIDGIQKAIQDIERGNYTLESRTLLHLESSEQMFDFPFALNDFVIHKKETSSMIVVHAYLNGEFLNSYWSDGLIVSTPTGSTGYSLSCGGPIIFPRSDSFVITPIAPHNLNVRPVVVSDAYVISFEIEGRANSYLASLDSRSHSINGNVQMAIRRADHPLNLIRLEGDHFMDTLRNKLSWGFDKRN